MSPAHSTEDESHFKPHTSPTSTPSSPVHAYTLCLTNILPLTTLESTPSDSISFFYGTLMDPDTLSAVTRLPESSLLPHLTPATLLNHRRYAVEDAFFPAILPETGSNVEGLAWFGAPVKAVHRLDGYEGEGDLYHRRKGTIVVRSKEGKEVEKESWIYVWARDKKECKGEWDVRGGLGLDD